MSHYVHPTEQLVTEIVVLDVARSISFYLSLGFQLLRDAGNFAELTWEDHQLYLAHASAFPEGTGLSQSPPAFPLANVRVMVPDVDACWQRVHEIGARVVSPIGDRYYGLRDFTVTDPDGFGIRFASRLTTTRPSTG